MASDPTGDTGAETLYRQGMSAWLGGDLKGARTLLREALGRGSPADAWTLASRRALGQISMALGEFEEARDWLRRLSGDPVSDALTEALRSRLNFWLGAEDAALSGASATVNLLATAAAVDVGSLMNGAIALTWIAGVLADLGYGREALDVCSRARQRVERAGVDDVLLAAGLTVLEASSWRLLGDADRASVVLTSLPAQSSDETTVRKTREMARIERDRGDEASAHSLYQQAALIAHESRHRSLELAILKETSVGPPSLKRGRGPIEEWAKRHLEETIAGESGYAVVVRLVGADSSHFAVLCDAISDLLSTRPDLGLLDGYGSDGEVWEIFLDGDDGDALWAEVSPLVRALPPAPGSRAVIHRNHHVEEIELA